MRRVVGRGGGKRLLRCAAQGGLCAEGGGEVRCGTGQQRPTRCVIRRCTETRETA